jgi:hypothetical protein
METLSALAHLPNLGAHTTCGRADTKLTITRVLRTGTRTPATLQKTLPDITASSSGTHALPLPVLFAAVKKVVCISVWEHVIILLIQVQSGAAQSIQREKALPLASTTSWLPVQEILLPSGELATFAAICRVTGCGPPGAA